jgi:ParB/RepB/Spo0J family partition protein
MKIGDTGLMPAKEFIPSLEHVRSMRPGWKDDRAKLKKLAESIAFEQYEEIEIFPNCEIFDGHRRHFSTLLNLGEDHKLKYRVVPYQEGQNMVMAQLIIDSNRENYTHTEIAMAYKSLRDVHGMKQCEIAEHHNVSEAHVSQHLSLAENPFLMDEIDEGRMTFEQAREELKSLRRKEKVDMTGDDNPQGTEGTGEPKNQASGGAGAQSYASQGETGTQSHEEEEPSGGVLGASPAGPPIDEGNGGKATLYEIEEDEIPKFIKEHFHTLGTTEILKEINKRASSFKDNHFSDKEKERIKKELKEIDSISRSIKSTLRICKFGTLKWKTESMLKEKSKTGWINERANPITLTTKKGKTYRIDRQSVRYIEYEDRIK